jgi:hypothetical protein
MTLFQQGVGNAAMAYLQNAAKAYVAFLLAVNRARAAAATAKANDVDVPTPFSGDFVPVSADSDGESRKLLLDLVSHRLIAPIEADMAFGPEIIIPNQKPHPESLTQ